MSGSFFEKVLFLSPKKGGSLSRDFMSFGFKILKSKCLEGGSSQWTDVAQRAGGMEGILMSDGDCLEDIGEMSGRKFIQVFEWKTKELQQ